jgi:predicted nucleotidyltransferase
VFRLDRAGILARLAEAARRLVRERPEVSEVLLFGSLARGDARPGSDADLLIVVSDSASAFLDRAAQYLGAFSNVGVGCDVIVYTEAEARRLRGEGSALLRATETEGLLLARRGG